MNRRNFIQNLSIAGSGLYLPTSLKHIFSATTTELGGFLLPISIDKQLEKLFQEFMTASYTKNATKVVEEGLNLVNIRPDAPKAYKIHYEKIISPKKNTQLLNGKGFKWTEQKMMEKMNDQKVKAQTPVHHVRDLSSFSSTDWMNYCDIADLQTAEDENGESMVYVTPKDKRKSAYQGTFWVPERLSYIIYNPTFYCYGLPTEDPVRKIVDDNLRRDIKLKLNRETTSTHYFTQSFFFQGDAACHTPQEMLQTIWWDHDDVLKEYYGLIEIKGCGDPTIQCKGNPSNGRPEITPSKK